MRNKERPCETFRFAGSFLTYYKAGQCYHVQAEVARAYDFSYLVVVSGTSP